MKLGQISQKRKTLGDQAYIVIRDAIIFLKFEPGQMIYENELAQSLGTSRTPIREAFRLLQAEELIEILPQKGALVSLISRKKVEETRFVRESLEISAFRKAAREWDPSDEQCRALARHIQNLLKEQKDAAEAKDHARFLELDEAFHLAVLERAGNQTLIAVIKQMRAHINRVRYLELRETGHAKDLVRHHEEIFRAVSANDEEDTEKRLLEHLRYLPYDNPRLIEKFPSYFKMDGFMN